MLTGVAAEEEERARLDLRCAAPVELGDIDQRQGRAAEARRNLLQFERELAEIEEGAGPAGPLVRA